MTNHNEGESKDTTPTPDTHTTEEHKEETIEEEKD